MVKIYISLYKSHHGQSSNVKACGDFSTCQNNGASHNKSDHHIREKKIMLRWDCLLLFINTETGLACGQILMVNMCVSCNAFYYLCMHLHMRISNSASWFCICLVRGKITGGCLGLPVGSACQTYINQIVKLVSGGTPLWKCDWYWFDILRHHFQIGVPPHIRLTIWLIYVWYLLKSCAHWELTPFKRAQSFLGDTNVQCRKKTIVPSVPILHASPGVEFTEH